MVFCLFDLLQVTEMKRPEVYNDTVYLIMGLKKEEQLVGINWAIFNIIYSKHNSDLIQQREF